MITKLETYELNGKKVELLTDGKQWGIAFNNRTLQLCQTFSEASDVFEDTIYCLEKSVSGTKNLE